jgi:predicted patatin/cPLA2 family phospholipase
MKKFGLVLEGGGLRCVYTAGVLDLFLDKDFHAPYIIGVSAGAVQAFSYISKQKGRSFDVAADYIGDHRYISLRNLFFKGGLFGMDFIFDEVPNHLSPFDYSAFENSGQELVIGVVNCETGADEYFYKSDKHDMFLMGRATCSLPLLSKTVDLYGKPYFDGGVVSPIPLKRAKQDGYEKNIVILTRDIAYRRPYDRSTIRLMYKVYRKYPELVNAYERRSFKYNEMLEYIEEQEKSGNVFVIRPSKPVTVKRVERDKAKLKPFYQEGYDDAEAVWPKLMEWLGDA